MNQHCLRIKAVRLIELYIKYRFCIAQSFIYELPKFVKQKNHSNTL